VTLVGEGNATRCRRPTFLEKLSRRLGVLRNSEVIALAELTPHTTKMGDLGLALDAFGDGRMAQSMGELDDGGGQASLALALLDRTHERSIDLEDVDRKPF